MASEGGLARSPSPPGADSEDLTRARARRPRPRLHLFESLVLLSWSEDGESGTSTIALFLIFATEPLAMPPVAGTRSGGRGWAFLCAARFAAAFFFSAFLFVIVSVLLPVSSGSWAGGSLLPLLWLPVAGGALDGDADSDLNRQYVDAPLGMPGCLCRKAWGQNFEP